MSIFEKGYYANCCRAEHDLFFLNTNYHEFFMNFSEKDL